MLSYNGRASVPNPFHSVVRWIHTPLGEKIDTKTELDNGTSEKTMPSAHLGVLTKEEISRYSRQLILPQVGAEGKKRERKKFVQHVQSFTYSKMNLPQLRLLLATIFLFYSSYMLHFFRFLFRFFLFFFGLSLSREWILKLFWSDVDDDDDDRREPSRSAKEKRRQRRILAGPAGLKRVSKLGLPSKPIVCLR